MTGVIYARYSSDNQREESIKGQIITFNYRDKKTEANINDVVAACSSSGSDIAQDGSPNSNNPNFVIIGDAFGFSVYFDYDRYERS